MRFPTDRNGKSLETGLLKSWPKKGPKLLWHTEGLGNGMHWAHPVVCNGRLYIRHGDALLAYDIKATDNVLNNF